MAIDIKNQVIQEIKSAAFGLFSIQLDESTDVASYAQLLVFARYVYSGFFKEEFLFCSPFATTIKATATDIWGKFVSWSTSYDGLKIWIPSICENRSPNVKYSHCMIHHQALASKILPVSFAIVLDQIIKIVNFIKGSVLIRDS